MPRAIDRSNARRVWLALLAVAALRATWLAVGFLYGAGDVRRHHVESAAFIFAGLLLFAALWFAWSAKASAAQRPTLPLAFVLGVAIVGVALYFPVLRLGLLSDDFLLLNWAASGQLLPAAWEFVRPIPLAMWGALSALVPASAVPVALHAVNLMLHLVNAVLVMQFAMRLGLTRERALVAGLIFVAWPLSVEAVAWAAAVFDQLLVTCAVLLASQAVAPLQTNRAITIAAVVSAVALLTKETAVVLPILAALAVVAVHGDLRRNRVVLVSLSTTIAYGLLRVALKGTSAPSMPPLSGYAVKEMVSRPFAALTVPIHQDLISTMPLVAATIVVAVVAALLSGAIGWASRPSSARRAIGLALWILVGVLPLLTNLFVDPDLQGGRYLYLPSVAWALLIADALPMDLAATRIVSFACVALLLATTAIATRAHLTHWSAAADIRDETLEDIAARAPTCGTATIAVPADHRGAYVFVNGLSEALRMRNIQATPGPLGSARIGECRLVPTKPTRPDAP